MPLLPELTQKIKTYLNGRKQWYLFEFNRNSKFTPRRIQQIVQECARQAGITQIVHPHLLRHSVRRGDCR